MLFVFVSEAKVLPPNQRETISSPDFCLPAAAMPDRLRRHSKEKGERPTWSILHTFVRHTHPPLAKLKQIHSLLIKRNNRQTSRITNRIINKQTNRITNKQTCESVFLREVLTVSNGHLPTYMCHATMVSMMHDVDDTEEEEDVDDGGEGWHPDGGEGSTH